VSVPGACTKVVERLRDLDRERDRDRLRERDSAAPLLIWTAVACSWNDRRTGAAVSSGLVSSGIDAAAV
jgi:hypothetical protein